MHGADAVLDLSLLQLKQWTKAYTYWIPKLFTIFYNSTHLQLTNSVTGHCTECTADTSRTLPSRQCADVAAHYELFDRLGTVGASGHCNLRNNGYPNQTTNTNKLISTNYYLSTIILIYRFPLQMSSMFGLVFACNVRILCVMQPYWSSPCRLYWVMLMMCSTSVSTQFYLLQYVYC